MLKDMGHLIRNYKYVRDHERDQGGTWTYLYQQRHEVAIKMFCAAVHAAREIKEPDYEKMWKELRADLVSEPDNDSPSTSCYDDLIADIEHRHGGGKV